MKKYKIFQFTDKNSGYYFWEGDSISSTRKMAKNFSKARVDGSRGFFELYENKRLTEWSTVGHKVVLQ